MTPLGVPEEVWAVLRDCPLPQACGLSGTCPHGVGSFVGEKMDNKQNKFLQYEVC